MMTHTPPHLTIQEAADLTGLSTHTLRYYERIGLLAPVGRAANGHRRYSEPDLKRIEFLNKLRATGMPIRQMRQFAMLIGEGEASIPERLALLQVHRETVLKVIAELQANLAVIERKIDLYEETERDKCKHES